MRIPQWFTDYKDQILKNIHSLEIIEEYAISHDVGKPYCLEIDSDGRWHYPNHAEISKKMWLDRGGNPIVGNLIGLDMIMHTKTKEEIKEIKLPIKDQITLLITALAELHANAELFGGIESTSFIIKWKKLNKLGNFLCDYNFNHSYVYVIVRRDLTNAQKAVQAGHSLVEATKAFINGDMEHPSIIICEVKSEDKLKMVMKELEGKVNYKAFQEPDRNNEYTALASEPVRGEKRKLFSRFQLIS